MPNNLLKTAAKGSIRYDYDGDGSLIARTVDGNRIRYVTDPLANVWRPLLAIDNAGQQTFFVWEGDAPLVAIEGGNIRFFLHDHLNSVRAVLDEQGRVVQQRQYTPFGVPRQPTNATGLEFGFAGLAFDSQARIYLTQTRSYDPKLGRFLQIDPLHRIPLGSQKDLSPYAYCGGDPVNFTDLTGARPKWVWGPENMLWQVFHQGFLLDEVIEEFANFHYGAMYDGEIDGAWSPICGRTMPLISAAES